ncbi:hypothetical protein FHW36_10679 [Chitinophaga polysaccharea]|uniref:Phage portal protein n=1 Tax=Chitinophaga polysaccharea TaxID=1293035 RepID=A0A561PL76_9BACT|nr:hypothetical protein [Chitinophaga polysaccharea]TWF38856.1 hypothetical protein FHW36_10679 [Chitinophaga polysaccharea]
MNSVSIGDGLLTLHFEDAAQPVFLEKKGKEYVFYGEKNDYPDYLLYLYNNSAKHSAIINGKVDYVCGNGWAFEQEAITPQDSEKAEAFIERVNKEGESLNEITGKVDIDFEIFNGAYLQVTWNKLGAIADIFHVDYTTVRSNKDNSMFFVSDEWIKYNPDGTYKTNNNPKYTSYPAFNPDKPKGTQILYIKKYHPGIDIYTLPTYRGSITWIEVDIEIGNYHLNNVKSGFFVNKLVNFNNGKPQPEEQKAIERLFDSKFSGVRGRKYMLSFNADSTKAATVADLNVSESDKLFDQLNKTTQQEIFTGHRVTSPMLFGVKTEGQLGGRSEMRDAYEIFQNTYVNGRQQWLENVFNMLAGYAGVQAPLSIQRTEPISFEFSEATQAQNMSKDEIREKMGLAPEQKQETSQAQEMINAINSLSPLVANKVLENLTSDELRAMVGLSPAAPGTLPQPNPNVKEPAKFTDEEDEFDVAVFAEFGQERRAFKIVKSKKVMFTCDEDEAHHFDDQEPDITKIQADVLDLLIKDSLISPELIAKTLNTETGIIKKAISALVDAGLIKVSEKNVRDQMVIDRKPVKEAKKLLKEKTPTTKSIQVMYSYEGPQDSRNRPFCAKMLELDRLYSRKDIEAISERLGYSVWARRGGWYHNPTTGKNQPFCRHSWVSNVVVKEK